MIFKGQSRSSTVEVSDSEVQLSTDRLIELHQPQLNKRQS